MMLICACKILVSAQNSHAAICFQLKHFLQDDNSFTHIFLYLAMVYSEPLHVFLKKKANI